MRVLQVHNQYKFLGGEDIVVRNEYLLLKKNGITVEQLFFNNSGVNPKKIISNKISDHILRKKIISFKPDVIHVHNVFYEASPSIFSMAQKMNVPTVMTIHNYRLLCPNALFLRNNQLCTKCRMLKFPIFAIQHKCFKDSYLKSTALATSLFYHNIKGTWTKNIDKFIVLTPFVKELFIDSGLNLNPTKIMVKANSTDDLAKEIVPVPEREGFLYVGRLSNEKGVDILVDAFNKLPKQQLTIIGEGPLHDVLKTRARNNIKFIGKQNFSVIINFLIRTKALIVPSICFEGLPNTILESFSAGTPVIASNINNINSIISNGHNGQLFETGDSENLCEVVKKFVITDCTSYYENARQTYELRYSHNRNFDSLIEIYNEIIKDKERRI